MIMFIIGFFTGWLVLALIVGLGVNHCIDEQERTKDILTEADLFNYYRGENDN